MAPAVIPIILQYVLQYGVPAAMEIIKLFQKEAITPADWEAAFALSQTPYGLTPQLTTPVVTDRGIIKPPTEPTTETFPNDIPAWNVIVKVAPGTVPGTIDLCNKEGNCWGVLPGGFTRTKAGAGEIWKTLDGLTFYLTAAAVAMAPGQA